MRKLVLIGAILIGLLPEMAVAAININTADVALLDTLPAIGPAKAAAIIEYRVRQGPFNSIAEIQEVKGIGPSTYATIAPLITVSGGVSVVASTPTVQPQQSVQGSKEQQRDSAVTSLTLDDHAREQTAAQTPAAVSAATKDMSTREFLSSSWTMLFLGLLLVAGGALLVL